ncbi:unnamed protein product [Bursaphelenchus xylophilus]|uniref:(pine wood nematode) hypothetical protein n=1 Tax=Bursaphelenchus xylophilus TaxID=6326 RepID=A0A1I7SHA4_BURXY|nr:unnamed protein product [Bursaphelenchus xylophilus]CAG9080559.1 unnamed protein product [Bursaphelenchus xylophilus]
MRFIVIFLLFAALLVAGDSGKIGQPCKTDADCANVSVPPGFYAGCRYTMEGGFCTLLHKLSSTPAL